MNKRTMTEYYTRHDVLPNTKCPRCDCSIYIATGYRTIDGDSGFTVKCSSYCGFAYDVTVDNQDMAERGRDAAMEAAMDGWTALKLREL